MFSVLILTLNEEKNLPACLASVGRGADVVVLDSGSSDGTRRIAEDWGARFFSRPFDDFAGQRNHAQQHIPFAHPLVFHLDADERMTPELRAECAALCAAPPADIDGWYAAPRMLWKGSWLRRCTDFPAWQARLVRAPGFSFIQVGHGQREAPSMRMGRLASCYLHEMCPANEEEWLDKHRRYAAQEARSSLRETAAPLRLAGLLSRDRLQRRRSLKSLAARLPFRPLFRFAYQYLLRGGFLDGRHALHYCLLISRYEGWISRERRRLLAAQAPLPPRQ